MLSQLNKFIKDVISMNMLDDSLLWNSLRIDYYPPHVDRLWLQIGDYKYYLHKIYNPNNENCLFHKHKWPSAIYLIKGSYEMGITLCEKEVGAEEASNLPVAAKIILSENSSYEMCCTHGLHYVKPITPYSLSIMISGSLYPEKRTESLSYKLKELPKEDIIKLLAEFKEHWPTPT